MKSKNEFDNCIEIWDKVRRICLNQDLSVTTKFALELIFFKYISENSIENVLNQDERHLYNLFIEPKLIQVNQETGQMHSFVETEEFYNLVVYIKELKHAEFSLLKLFNFFISKYSETSGKKGGSIETPNNVCQLMCELATTKEIYNLPIKIYDPVMGTGRLLNTLYEKIEKKFDRSPYVYGEEINSDIFKISRMTTILQGVAIKKTNLKNDDVLNSDSFSSEKFDYIVENPPYSARWDIENSRIAEEIQNEYDVLPPRTKADFAFLIQGLNRLSEDGIMVITLPHGILFRGAREEKIRRHLIENNLIHAIIGLPSNLYYSTSIPTVVIVLKKKRNQTGILFIDASKDYEKGKNRNIISKSDISKILKTYNNYSSVAKYSHVASMKEIISNDYNLNIPRYVDTFEEPKKIDIAKSEERLSEIENEIADNKNQIEILFTELNKGKG
jgi:type I restriction enzyme M protein